MMEIEEFSLDPVAGSEKKQKLSEPEPLELSLQQENLYLWDFFPV